MRLVRCHIENFGKLHDVTLDFHDGLHIFCRQNGWGKSTLAAFVRVMLYGFLGESKRSNIENERKRYEPWQGGIYGGSLTIEVNGKEYVINRIFKDKAANDVFELRDAVTNLESRDYTSNIGEELFQINAEAFLRTAFIGQQDCVTNTTDSINAKIGNLADNTNDLNSYEVADEALKDILNKMSPRVKRGSIHQLQDEITSLKKTVADGNGIEKAIETLQGYYGSVFARLEEIKQKKMAISVKQEEVSRYQDVLAKKESYDLLCKEVKEQEDALKEKAVAFPKRVPTEAELRNALEWCSDIERLQLQIKPDSEEEEKYEQEKTFFQSEHPSTEIKYLLQLWQEYLTIKSTLAVQKAGVEMMRRQQKSDLESKRKKTHFMRGMAIAAAAFGGIFVLLGVVKAQTAMMLIGAGGIAVGIALFVIGSKQTAETTQQEETLLEQELRDNERRAEDAYAHIRGYLSKRTMAFEESGEGFSNPLSTGREAGVSERLQELLNRALIYENLGEKIAACEKQRPEIERRQQELRIHISDFLAEIGAEPAQEQNLREQLQGLSEAVSAYKIMSNSFELACKKRDDYERRYNLKEIVSDNRNEEMISLQELQEQYATYEKEAEELRNGIKTYEEQLNVLQEQFDEWVATTELLKNKEDEYTDKKRQYELLTKTKEYLAKAKESLTARYTGPIMERFNYYYSIVSGVTDSSYYMDANINVTKEERGLQRDVTFLSTGYQDLIGVCLRLSLVEAMYSDKKPMLMMDDPFVNLDDERAEGAKRLLDALAKEYQIIYFTCRN